MQLSAPALVRPRCYDPDTGDVVLLEDEIGDFLRTHPRGTIEILGDQGAGKSTALEYLACLSLPAYVRLMDDAPPEHIAALATENVLIYTTRRIDHSAQVDLCLRLAPWGDDELIEYLLAVHPAECGSVMQRLLAADDRCEIAGLPELCTLVLEQMASHCEIPGAKSALRRVLDAHRYDPRLRELAGAYAWTLQLKAERSAEREARRFAAGGGSDFLRRALHWELVQRMLAAEHLFNALAEGRPKEFLLCTWPRELVEETALLIRDQKTVIERLLRLADEHPQRYQATAASLLHACGHAWRPAVRRRARLTSAYLDGIAWSGVNLTEAHLNGTQLSLADLKDARLDEANAAAVRLRGASLRGASLAAIHAPGADLSHADLSQINARKANLFGAKLIKARFERASLIDVDLGRADLTSAGFQGADLLRACLVDATIDEADFSGARLDGANLSDLPLHKACWDGARFVGAKLRGVNLEDADLPDANFERATLVGAYLTGSRLPRANFRSADLRKTGLADIHWEQADLRDADLRYCTFHMGSTRSGLLFTPYASEGSRMGFYTDDYEEQFFKRPEEIRKANLRGADLRGARIKDVDFYLVDLRNALYTSDQADHFRRCRAILE